MKDTKGIKNAIIVLDLVLLCLCSICCVYSDSILPRCIQLLCTIFWTVTLVLDIKNIFKNKRGLEE